MAQHSKFGKKLLASIKQMTDALGTQNKSILTIREVRSLPDPSHYNASRVRATRHRLQVSQAVFASLLGISKVLCQAWEQGSRKPSKMACRLLDEINENPMRWKQKLRAA